MNDDEGLVPLLYESDVTGMLPTLYVRKVVWAPVHMVLGTSAWLLCKAKLVWLLGGAYVVAGWSLCGCWVELILAYTGSANHRYKYIIVCVCVCVCVQVQLIRRH